MSTRSDSVVLPGVVAVLGIAIAVGMIARQILGPASPLRDYGGEIGGLMASLDTWGLILGLGIPAAVVSAILLWLILEARGR